MSSHVFQENCREPLISLNKCEKLHRRKPLGQLLRVTKVEDEDDLFEFGGKYPGIVIGQEKCEGSHGLIPKYMGWLWNVQSLGISKLHQGFMQLSYFNIQYIFPFLSLCYPSQDQFQNPLKSSY